MGGSVRPLSTGGQDSPTGRPEAARRASARDGASQSRSSVQIEEPTSGSVFCFKVSASPLAGETRHRRGPEKTACRDTWPSAAQPIPSLPPRCSLLPALCSLLSVDRGYTPRAASPLSWTAHYAKQRESDDTNNQHTLTDSTVYCDITWITASSCHADTVNLLYRSSGTGRCHRTLPGLRNLSDIAHRLDIVLKN